MSDDKGRKVAVLIDLKKHGPGLRISGTGWSPNLAAKRQGYRWMSQRPISSSAGAFVG